MVVTNEKPTYVAMQSERKRMGEKLWEKSLPPTLIGRADCLAAEVTWVTSSHLN
jgi:hypothetical protein